MKKVVFVLLMCCLGIACGGKKEVKPLSLESKTATEAFALAETIRSAFVRKDLTTIQKNATEAGYRDVTKSRKTYDSVEMSFTHRWVEIDGSALTLNIAWKSSWTSSGRKSEERGMAVFGMEGNPLKLTKIMGANPFILPDK